MKAHYFMLKLCVGILVKDNSPVQPDTSYRFRLMPNALIRDCTLIFPDPTAEALLHRRAVIVSYSIVLASAALAILPRLFRSYSYSYDYGYYSVVPGGFFVAGLVLGPYFGLAGLIAEENQSVWTEVVRLIERHISFPFIAGASIYYGSLVGFPSPIVMLWYGVFVILATLIAWKSKKAEKASARLLEPPA